MLWVNIFTKKIEVNLVTASKITQAETSAVLTSSGYVVAQRKASVASKATGRLIYLRVVEGGPVKKNQIIARIEDEDVKALLQLAKANLFLKKAELPDTKNKYERQKILYEKNLGTKSNFESFKKAFDSEKRLKQFEPKIEQKFFEEQSELMANFIRILGIFITVIFSLGATIGAMITMYATVANRTIEIGTLRSLGFSRRSILAVFLFESILISLAWGIIGVAFASGLQFFSISTLNFASFSEISFSFALSSDIIIGSLIFACSMGIFGGFLPSVRAARMNIINALRAG